MKQHASMNAGAKIQPHAQKRVPQQDLTTCSHATSKTGWLLVWLQCSKTALRVRNATGLLYSMVCMHSKGWSVWLWVQAA